jgi:2-amino-4-hydroxy-6-hydroxymethyldihydropteridine diphosphokinase
MEVLLLLGGNTGDPLRTLGEAILRLGQQVGEVLATSRDHWTEPWGFRDPRLFLNKAVLLRTDKEPIVLLEMCLAIERGLGRERTPGNRYAARPIDIDVLLIGDRVIDVPGLQVPHPRMHERYFALAPAADVVPLWVHPLLGRKVIDLLNDVLQASSSGSSESDPSR